LASRVAVRGRRSFTAEGVETRRKELLDATLESIASLGLEGATVRVIATRAGVTPGLIRHYFVSKELMFQAAYSRLIERMFESALSIAETGGPRAKDRLRAYLMASFRSPIVDQSNLTLWSTFISQLSVDPALAAIHRETYVQARNRLQEYIVETMQEEGKPLSDDEARRMAISINGMIDGLWLEGTMAPDLFADGELALVAVTSVERLLDVAL
jgi:TetR/AcrR family transcriptional repressor of bet genes